MTNVYDAGPALDENPCFLVYASQQTRYIEPMLGQCWSDVVDGGPILAQHWFNVTCLLGHWRKTTVADHSDVRRSQVRYLD